MTALLFCDMETTSLNPVTATLLECAWCITDMDGTQRTPIYSRFLAIPPPEGHADVPSRERRFGGGTRWALENAGDSAAKQMAVESGLYDDWMACTPRLRIDRGVELARLILDDLAAVCDQGDPERGRPAEYIHICGAGAARFDFTLLAQRCPGVTPSFGARQPTHYRPVDTSGNQTGLLGNNYEKEMIKWAVGEYGEAIAYIELAKFPHYLHSSDGVAAWVIDGAQPHRAAPDVARSIVVQRALWRYGKPLREALGV